MPNLSSEEIFDLVQKCGEGDLSSLELFFELYSQDIYNFPLKVFHLTEDDASDFFIYAFERLKSGKKFKSFFGKSSFKTWFFSVLRNLVIDWKRTKRELKIQSIIRYNKEGEEILGIEDEPDTREVIRNEALEITEHFQEAMRGLKLENRVIFKLTFLYYLHMEEEEINFLSQKSNKSIDEIQIELLRLREELCNREVENIRMEDKITALYLAILEIQEKLERVNTLKKGERERLEISLRKKYEQRKRLIDRKLKGHFLVKTPYKVVAKYLGITEGGVSVSLVRVIEKVQKNFRNWGDLR